MNPPPSEERIDRILDELSLPDKIALVDGRAGFPVGEDGRLVHPVAGHAESSLPPSGAIGTDGYVPANPLNGVPALHLCGAGVGLTDMYNQRAGLAQATVFPAPIGQTATWDPEITALFGRALAREAKAVGVNVLLAGACNLAVEPWCGRLFEYHGEDPLLSGVMVAGEVRGCQDEGVLASLKHYAANFCETGRFFVDMVIDERRLRHTELRVFETALEHCEPAAIMAAYNKVNGTYACEHPYLINQILKQEWGFDGWVMSDWGATHSTTASALAGLDQEFAMGQFYSDALAEAVGDGAVPVARLDDMVRRILRYALRLEPAEDPEPLDIAWSLDVAEHIARRSMTLLANDGVLPLQPDRSGSLLLIGGNADRAVLSGGGSASVRPRFGDPVNDAAEPVDAFLTVTWVPSSPLRTLRNALPGWDITYRAVDDPDLLEAAAAADLVVIMATQHACEGRDHDSLALPAGQDELILRVAAVNPDVVVVLQTGGPVLTGWADHVRAVLAAWYPGHRGAEALAAVLTGAENPSGKLPVTFPASADQPHHPHAPTVPIRPGCVRPERVPPHGDFSWVDPGFRLEYDQPVGYQWYDANGLAPAFCFGHGLSYTTFDYADLDVTVTDDGLRVTFLVSNSGEVAGREISQVYATLPTGAGEPPRRLAGWWGVDIEPRASEHVSIHVPLQTLAVWSVSAQCWMVPAGDHRIWVGRSSRDLPLSKEVGLTTSTLPCLADRIRSGRESGGPRPLAAEPAVRPRS